MTSSNDEDYRDRQLATPACTCFHWEEQPPPDSSDCPACAIRTCIAHLTVPELETMGDMLNRVSNQFHQAREAHQRHQGILELQTQLNQLFAQEFGRSGRPGQPGAYSERTSSRLPRIDPHEMQQRVLDQISATKEQQQQFVRTQLNIYLLIHAFVMVDISTRSTIPESFRQVLVENAEHLRQIDKAAQEYLEALQMQLGTIQIIINTPTL